VVSSVRAREPLPESPDSSQLGAHFSGSAELSGIEQLEIYREQFWLRHLRALSDDFPGLALLMGQKWEAFSRTFLAESPLGSFSLRDLGQSLPSHLSLKFPTETLWLEMAALEWAYIESFDAKDVPPLGAEALLALNEDAWAQARLELAPSLQLFQFQYPVHDYRRALKKGAPIEPIAGRRFLVVYRHASLSVYDRVLPETAWLLLDRLRSGVSLGMACDELAATESHRLELEQHLGEWFRTFGELGFFVAVHAN